MSWQTALSRIKNFQEIEDEDIKELLDGQKERNYGQWKNIGMNWAQCCRDVLEAAERKWIPPRENSLAADGWEL